MSDVRVKPTSLRELRRKHSAQRLSLSALGPRRTSNSGFKRRGSLSSNSQCTTTNTTTPSGKKAKPGVPTWPFHLQRNHSTTSPVTVGDSAAGGGLVEPRKTKERVEVARNNPFKRFRPNENDQTDKKKNNAESPATVATPSIFDLLNASSSASKSRRKPPQQKAAPRRSFSDVLGPLRVEETRSSYSSWGLGISKAPRTSFGDFLQVPFKIPPIDWDLKSKATFTSKSSFSWCQKRSTRAFGDGMISFVEEGIKFPESNEKNQKLSSASSSSRPTSSSSRSTSSSSSVDLRKNLTEFHNASLYWTHPSNQLSPLISQAWKTAQMKHERNLLPSDRSCQKLVEECWRCWTESFTCLYSCLRNLQSDYFYLIPHNSNFVVLFLSGKYSSKDLTSFEPSAIITRSTEGFRRLLRERGCNFERPLQTAVNGDPLFTNERVDSINELAQYEKAGGKIRFQNEKSQTYIESQPNSLLLFRGRNEVHKLHNFLLNYCKRGANVPSLYSQTPFVNGMMKSMRMTKNISVKAVINSNVQTLHVLEFEGPILPLFVVKMCNLLNSTQKEGFELDFTALKNCSGLNALPEVVIVKDLLHLNNQQCIALSHQEETSHKKGKEVTPKNSLVPAGCKKIKCEGGVFWILLDKTFK